MRKFKTDEIAIKINLTRDEGGNQNFDILYLDSNGCTLEEHRITIPSRICKQIFNDANLTQHIINFFIKE